MGTTGRAVRRFRLRAGLHHRDRTPDVVGRAHAGDSAAAVLSLGEALRRGEPRDHWLEDWEGDAILAFHDAHPLEGYWRLSFMMLDARTVAVSPTTVYRALTKAGRLDRCRGKPSKKGTGFQQPLLPHKH